MSYPKVGDNNTNNSTVFELILNDFIPFVDPKKYGIKRETGINPKDYFITSGDAVEKSKVLEKDLWKYAGELRKRSVKIIASEKKVDIKEAQKSYRNGIRPLKPKRFCEYESAVWSAAGKSRSMLNALIRAKGDNCFLETEWDNHSLLCIQKNPRR